MIEPGLVGIDMLFKVEKRMINLFHYEDPYHVKRICNQAEIIDLFMLNEAMETPVLVGYFDIVVSFYS